MRSACLIENRVEIDNADRIPHHHGVLPSRERN